MRLGALVSVAACLLACLVSCGKSQDPSPLESQVVQQVGSKTRDDSAPPLLVYVSDEGVTRLDGEELLDDASILTRARDYQSAHPHGLAVVRCAPAAIHGRAQRVVELLEEARIPSVAIDRIK